MKYLSLKNFVISAVVIAIFFFLGKSLYENAHSLSSYHFSVHAGYFSLAYVFAIGAIAFFGVVWKRIVDFLEPGNRMTLGRAIYISMIGWFGRYVPGRFTHMVSKVYLSQLSGVSVEVATLGSVLDTLHGFLGALLPATLFFLFLQLDLIGESTAITLVTLAAVGISSMLFLDSPWFYRLLNFGLKLIKREPLEATRKLSRVQKLEVILLFAVGHLLFAFGFFFLVKAVIGSLPVPLFPLMGIFLIAAVAGSASLLFPAGLGVREAVLLVGLQVYLPLEVAALITILARAWDVTADVLLLIFLGIARMFQGMKKKGSV